MDNLGSWLAADRRAAMAHGETLPDRADGSVLFADISGSTPLTEALLRAHGPKRGAEEITVQLERVYDGLIGSVDRFGGSVIGFSGDAITCWFGGDDGGRAVASALDMQAGIAQMASVRVGTDPPIALGVKVAVAVGPVRRFQVADPRIQLLDVIAGATLDAVAAVEQMARPGEVVVEADTAVGLGSRLGVREWRNGDDGRCAVVDAIEDVEATPLAPAVDELTEEQVRPWVLPSVFGRLASGEGAFLADLRPVVAIFVRFSGIAYDDDEAEAVLDRYVRWAQGVLHKYEGTLIDVTIGDKGSYLAAVVGAPLTHDDDAARAVAAALELQRPPVEVEPARTIGIGVSRGRMRTGSFGGSGRRTYGVQGADMNLAARLMQRATDGRIVVSSQVAEAVGDRFELAPLGPVPAKGFAQPIEAFEVNVRSSGGAATRHPQPAGAAIVGRETERAVIAEQLAQLAAGTGGILTIEGEAGIGKSRLVEELLDQARAMAIATLVGAADAVEQTTPYHAWRAIFADALELGSAPDDPARARSWLLERLAAVKQPGDGGGSDVRGLAPLLTPVLPFAVPDTAETELMTGQSRAETAREVLAAILRERAAEAPLVVHIDDAHWLDSPSWSLLVRLIGVPEPLLVVLTMRPVGEQAPPEVLGLLGAPVTHRLMLNPLAGDDIEALIRQRLGVRSIPPAMAEVIRERAEGNPFFSEELAYAFRDRGLIVVREGRCDIAPDLPDLRELDFPDTVEGVVTSRIDRLTPSQQMALKVASVIGRTFSSEVVRAVHPIPNQLTSLDGDLAELARLDLTPVDQTDGGPGFSFKHAITHDVAYNLMLFAQRRQLHRALGERLEASGGEVAGPHLSQLAHHWSAAADDEGVESEVSARAIDYLGRASKEAFDTYANVEAATNLHKQLRLLARQPEAMSRDQMELGAQTMLAFSLVQSRGYGDAEVEASYLRAQALSDRVEDFEPLAFILYGLFSYYASRAEYDAADRIAERLLALAERTGDQATLSVGHQSRAIVRLLRGDLAAGLADGRTSYEIADRLGDRAFFGFGVDFRIYTSTWIALAECLLGYPDQAMATYDAGQALAERQPYARGFVLAFAGIPQLLDDPAETLRRADDLAALSGRYSFFLFTIISNLFRGWAVAASQGDPEILQLIDGSLPVPRFVKLDSFLPWYLALSADARRRLGRADEGLAAVDEALAMAAAAGGSFFEAELHRLRGEILQLQGAPSAGSQAAFETAVSVARRQGARWWELRATTSLARLQGNSAEAAATRRDLAGLVAGFSEGESTADLVAARALLATEPVAGASPRA